MNPESDQLFGILELSSPGNQKSGENIGNMSDIEFIMEIDGSFSESGDHISMDEQSSLNDRGNLFLDTRFEVFEVATQEGAIYNEKGFIIREGNWT